jgi:hypothetical protein
MVNAPQQVVQPAPPQRIPTKKTSNRSLYFIGCFLIFLLMIGSAVAGAYIGSKYFPQGKEDTSEDTTDQDTDTTNGDDSDTSDDETAAEETLKVTSPVADQEVNGKIFAEGEASEDLEELTIRVYDDDWNMLGEETAALESGDSNPIRSWSIFLDVVQSPTSLTGYVRVFPRERGESSKLTQTINVRFQNLVSPGRLKLFAPLKFQVMQGQTVTFRGQMKDFLEGTMGVRLKDESGNKLFDDTISASGDNYGQYAHFEKTIEHKVNLKYHGTRGSWELFEVDVEGEAGDIILTLPVRFPED